MAGVQPSDGGPGNFRFLATNQEEEDAFDYVQYRRNIKFTGVIGSIAHIVKGALGAGMLSGHVGYMKAGFLVAVPLNVICGMYMAYCLNMLVGTAQVLYRRTRVPAMSYPDVGEAALACFPSPRLAKFSKAFRYLIDLFISIDLFGACACYQIIIAKSIKQLVENTYEVSDYGHGGYPELRVYMLIMVIPIIGICMITHLKWLAPFSLAANIVIVITIMTTIYYALNYNPRFEDLVGHTKLPNYFKFIGMTVFSMSCAGIVIPVENNMQNPKKFKLVLNIGMSLVVGFTFLVSFFGYVAFREECESPITVNFPMNLSSKILKGLIIVMIYVTHALNFWVPFNLIFYYMKKRINQEKVLMWELIYRAIFVVMICFVAIIFPNVDALMGFIGALCLSNMAFIWPNVIHLLVFWHRPGLGKCKWRLWRGIFLIVVGIFICICGSLVNGYELIICLMSD